MARFSLVGEDDGGAPSTRTTKRRRTTNRPSNIPQPPPAQTEGTLAESNGTGQDRDGVGADHEDCRNPRSISGGDDNGTNLPGDSVLSSGVGYISITLTDPDVLDCTICIEPLSIPVYQCENGHIACSSCCIKVGNKCPSCSWPIGYNRCRAIEKVLEASIVSCQNMKYGCEERVSYSKKHEHEVACVHAPCSCPLPSCDFVGSSKNLYTHFSLNHLSSSISFWYNCLFSVSLEKSQKYVILQEETEEVIFVLNHDVERLGSVVNVNCIAPSSSLKKISYDLIARKGNSSVRLQSFMECVVGRVEQIPPEWQFLVVPNDFNGSDGNLKLDVCIRRNRKASSASL